MQSSPSGDSPAVGTNIPSDCMVSALVGGGLVFFGLGRRSLVGLGLAAMGFYLVRNALGGTCPNMLRLDDHDEEKLAKRRGVPLYSGGDEHSDAVEEASMESFPASDPPALSRPSA